MSVYKLACPACGGRMKIRNSVGQTPTFRTMYGQCQELVCGATFAGALSWEYELSPSGLDSSRVALPVAPSKARMKALQDLRVKTDQLDLLDEVEELERME